MFNELIKSLRGLTQALSSASKENDPEAKKKNVGSNSDGKWITIFPNGGKMTAKINPNTGTVLSGRLKGYNIKHLPKKAKKED